MAHPAHAEAAVNALNNSFAWPGSEWLFQAQLYHGPAAGGSGAANQQQQQEQAAAGAGAHLMQQAAAAVPLGGEGMGGRGLLAGGVGGHGLAGGGAGGSSLMGGVGAAPAPADGEPDGCVLSLTNLPAAVDESELRALLSAYGRLLRLDLSPGATGGGGGSGGASGSASGSAARALFATRAEAEHAQAALNGALLRSGGEDARQLQARLAPTAQAHAQAGGQPDAAAGGSGIGGAFGYGHGQGQGQGVSLLGAAAHLRAAGAGLGGGASLLDHHAMAAGGGMHGHADSLATAATAQGGAAAQSYLHSLLGGGLGLGAGGGQQEHLLLPWQQQLQQPLHQQPQQQLQPPALSMPFDTWGAFAAALPAHTPSHSHASSFGQLGGPGFNLGADLSGGPRPLQSAIGPQQQLVQQQQQLLQQQHQQQQLLQQQQQGDAPLSLSGLSSLAASPPATTPSQTPALPSALPLPGPGASAAPAAAAGSMWGPVVSLVGTAGALGSSGPELSSGHHTPLVACSSGDNTPLSASVPGQPPACTACTAAPLGVASLGSAGSSSQSSPRSAAAGKLLAGRVMGGGSAGQLQQ